VFELTAVVVPFTVKLPVTITLLLNVLLPAIDWAPDFVTIPAASNVVPPVPPRPTGKVPLVSLSVLILGILAASKVPDVILLAAKLGILASPRVPEVILEAAKSGIRAVPKVPLVILPAPRFGILAASIWSVAL